MPSSSVGHLFPLSGALALGGAGGRVQGCSQLGFHFPPAPKPCRLPSGCPARAVQGPGTQLLTSRARPAGLHKCRTPGPHCCYCDFLPYFFPGGLWNLGTEWEEASGSCNSLSSVNQWRNQAQRPGLAPNQRQSKWPGGLEAASADSPCCPP